MGKIIFYAFLIAVIFLVGCSSQKISDSNNNKIIVPKPGEPLVIQPPPVPPEANMGLKSPQEMEREALGLQNINNSLQVQ